MASWSGKVDKDVRKRRGLSLKRCRESRGMTQAALGHEIGVSQQQIANYEKGRGNIGWDRVTQIAKVLEFSCEEIMGAEPTGLAEAPSPPYLAGRTTSDAEALDAMAMLDAAVALVKANLRARLTGRDR